MLKYDYLIAYKFSHPDCLTPCDGTMCMSRDNKINNFDELSQVVEFITSTLPKGSTNVAVYNIVLLGRNKH